MASNSFGDFFRITTFGESHGPAIGVIIDGVPPGLTIDIDQIQVDLDRRRPGANDLTTPRKEADKLSVLSGIFETKTTGAAITITIQNKDPKSHHYDTLKNLYRPGHADFTWDKKYAHRDYRGGGRTSGRETAVRVAAGAIAKQLLATAGVNIYGHVTQIGTIKANSFDKCSIEDSPVRCGDPNASENMAASIRAARKDGDSLGGIVKCVAEQVPVGWGDPVFSKLDALLAGAMLSIGAVKGFEIGEGFSLASLRGSEANDEISPTGFLSNRMGGVLGGISNGEDIAVTLAVKPTSSIRKEQQTVTTDGKKTIVVVPGRHDPCICARVVPVAEAMMALVLADCFLKQRAIKG